MSTKSDVNALERRAQSSTIWQTCFTIIGVSISLVCPSLFWLNVQMKQYVDSKITDRQSYTETRINQKLDLYDHLVFATQYVLVGTYDKALPEYQKAFSEADTNKQSIDQTRLAPFLTRYLEAISSIERPEVYETQFNDALALFDRIHVSKTAADHNYIGWYYFLTGDLSSAQTSFSSGLKLSQLSRRKEDTCNSKRGCCYCSLAEGDAKSAESN